jgi:hemerythrin superfamily protein
VTEALATDGCIRPISLDLPVGSRGDTTLGEIADDIGVTQMQVSRVLTAFRGTATGHERYALSQGGDRIQSDDQPIVTSTAREKPMSTDAIVMLKDDHKVIRRVFQDFENAGDDARKTKGKLVDRIIELLTVHTYIENEVMYPRVRELVPDLEDDVLESYEEHHVADVLVMELVAMTPDDERFTAKTTVLIENVRHHMEEEEEEWFPQVREALGRKALREIGAQLAEARDRAPRKPSQPSALKKTIDAVIA